MVSHMSWIFAPNQKLTEVAYKGDVRGIEKSGAVQKKIAILSIYKPNSMSEKGPLVVRLRALGICSTLYTDSNLPMGSPPESAVVVYGHG